MGERKGVVCAPRSKGARGKGDERAWGTPGLPVSGFCSWLTRPRILHERMYFGTESQRQSHKEGMAGGTADGLSIRTRRRRRILMPNRPVPSKRPARHMRTTTAVQMNGAVTGALYFLVGASCAQVGTARWARSRQARLSKVPCRSRGATPTRTQRRCTNWTWRCPRASSRSSSSLRRTYAGARVRSSSSPALVCLCVPRERSWFSTRRPPWTFRLSNHSRLRRTSQAR